MFSLLFAPADVSRSRKDIFFMKSHVWLACLLVKDGETVVGGRVREIKKERESSRENTLRVINIGNE